MKIRDPVQKAAEYPARVLFRETLVVVGQLIDEGPAPEKFGHNVDLIPVPTCSIVRRSETVDD